CGGLGCRAMVLDTLGGCHGCFELKGVHVASILAMGLFKQGVLPSSDDFSPIVKEKSVTFSNPLFKFDDKYISNDVNPLFDKVLENIKKGNIIYLESLLIDDTSPNLPPEVFLDHDPRSLKDEPDNDDLMTEDKVSDPGIYEKSFSPTFVKLTFDDRHYFPITFVIRIFIPYLTYSVDSSFLLSSGSEDTIFDLGISTFHFSSLKSVAYENPIVIFLFFCFCPKDKGIRGELS
ncbi:hypothetical protein Tco_0874338, partial [Tanacetum coccineum]